MPPKAAVVPAPPPPPSPSPPPSAEINDAQDLLVIHDFMDTIDQIPPELTRVNSDLNELGAVLYSTLVALEEKLQTLTAWIHDPRVGQEKRFHLLQEIAEEAARYKLGGDDKIRVAGGACDGIMTHQKHLINLLNASTLLQLGPPSPYTQALTLALPLPPANTRRAVLARAANSPFGGRGYATGSGTGEIGREKDTPSKKKKSRVAQLGMREDDELSSVGGGRKGQVSKKKKTNRAVSPADSLGSTSAFALGKGVEPRTARQLAAAANKARKIEADDGSDVDDEPLARKGVAMQITPSTDSMFDRGVLGLDMGVHALSREGSHQAEKNRNRARGTKRHRADEEDEDDSEMDPAEGESKPGTTSDKSARAKKVHKSASSKRADGVSGDMGDDGMDEDIDEDRESGDDDVHTDRANARGQGNGGPPKDSDRNGQDRKGDYGATGPNLNNIGPDNDLDLDHDNDNENELDIEGENEGEGGGDVDADSTLYCTCKQISYGEMIGCDDDDCEIEWFHVGCVGLDKPPGGTWYCPQCTERRRAQPSKKKSAKAKGRK